jgi:hypothetical protein
VSRGQNYTPFGRKTPRQPNVGGVLTDIYLLDNRLGWVRSGWVVLGHVGLGPVWYLPSSSSSRGWTERGERRRCRRRVGEGQREESEVVVVRREKERERRSLLLLLLFGSIFPVKPRAFALAL